MILWLRTAMALAVVQATVEAVSISFAYRDVVLAPARFFPIHIYDGFTQCYLWLAWRIPLPQILDRFLAQGFATKLAILGPLLATNLVVASGLGLVLGAIIGSSSYLRRRTHAPTALMALASGQFLVHVLVWIATVHLPVEPSAHNVAANFVRNFIHDGTALALAVLIVASAVTAFTLQRPRLLGPIAVASLAMVAATTGRSGAGDLAAERRAGSASVARGYNVVLISIDSLRADHLGAYGYGRDTSPTIDTLAGQGVVFRNTSSTTSWTLPSHISMLTGRSLLGHGVVADDRRLAPDVPSLAESFAKAGYATGAIVSAPYLESRYGFARGFDEYDDHTIRFATHGASYKQVTAPILQQAANAWIEDRSASPFFLFLHYWDVHYDYIPGPPYDSMFDPDYDGDVNGENFYFNPEINARMDVRDLEHVVALYDGEIRLVDDHIAMLRRSLEHSGVANRTVIVVTADHGDEFFEHGRKGHHRTLYDEVLRVPWVVYVPGATPSRQQVEMEASIVDITPTILGLVGIEVPGGVEGQDLSGVAYGGYPQWDRATLGELYRFKTLNVQVSLRRRGRKIIQHFKRRWLESFDLEADPGETSSLAAYDRGTARLAVEMTARLNADWPPFSSRLRESGVLTAEIDVETEQRLRSLGYMQ